MEVLVRPRLITCVAGAYLVPLDGLMEPGPDQSDDLLTSTASEPLVPILRVDDGQFDPTALATWHEALSNTVAVEVPHDLMAMWLYPSQGGAVLLGPAELAEDDLVVPLPSPHLKSEQLAQVEKIVLEAGYGSATCIPIRFGKRDIALMLVANLRESSYGPVERVLLQCVASQVGPMLGRIARQWKPTGNSFSRQQERIAGLVEILSQANGEAATPQGFVTTISRGLTPLLPHDHMELLLSDGVGAQYFRLGEHPGGPLWKDPSLVISRLHLNIASIFGSQVHLLVGDTYQDERWPRGFLTASEPGGADIRAVAGARLQLRGKASAYLLVGSIGPELYGDDDAELVTLLAGLIAPQIGSFLLSEGLPAAPVAPSENSPQAELLFRVAGLLATTPDPAVVTQLIEAEAKAALPFDKLTFALRMTQTDRVVLLEPGEQRTLANLPLISVGGTALARILRGELPCAFAQDGGDTRMIVPLRVAGRVHGALVFSAAAPSTLTEHHVLPAQHLADIVAAHLELLRRVAMVPHPSVSRSDGRSKSDELKLRLHSPHPRQ